MECLVGPDAARAWQLGERSCLSIRMEPDFGLDSSVECGQPGALTVVGILSDELDFQFLRGGIVMTESTFEALYHKPPEYNCFFAYASSIWSPVRRLRHDAVQKGLTVFRVRYLFLQGGPPAWMALILLFLAGFNFQNSAAASVCAPR